MNVAFKSSRNRPPPVSIPVQMPERTSGKLPDRWNDDRDKLLLATRGRYSKLAQLSQKWGLGTQVLLARWHRLRAEKSNMPRVGKPVVSFEMLVGTTTPAVAETLLYLRVASRTYQEIADNFNVSETGAKAKITRARCHCDANNWEICGRSNKNVYLLSLEQKS